MNYKEIVDLIKLVSKSDLTEVKIKDGDLKLKIRTKNYLPKNQGGATINSVPMQYSAPPAVPSPTIKPQENDAPIPDLKPQEKADVKAGNQNLLEVKSPIVGTFYRSSSPEKGPYVKVGDEISVGSVVCIVEAMKLFNEIESEVAGKVVKVMVEDASPVEYDQVLFLVDPS